MRTQLVITVCGLCVITASMLPGINNARVSGDKPGPAAADVALAQSTGPELLDAPRLEGLTQAQLATLANYSLQHVPEPSSMMLTALAALGWRARRKS